MWEWLDIVFWGNTIRDYMIFLAVLLFAYLLKSQGVKLIAKAFYYLLGKFKGGGRITELIQHIKAPLETILFVVIIYMGIIMMESPEAIDEHPVFVKSIALLAILFRILMVFLFVWFVNRILDFIALGLIRESEEIEENKEYNQAIPFVRDIAKVLIFITAMFFVFADILGFNVTSLIAGLGIGGLAIALAAQETLANLLASFTIFIDKPFRVGDFIQVGETVGTVEKVGFRSTRIRTLEKSYLSVPNKLLVDSTVDNLTLRTYRRARFTVGVTYQTSVEQLQNIVTDIKDMLDNHPNTTNDGVVRFHEFGDSSLDIIVNFFIDTMDWATFMQIREETNFEIMKIIEKHGSSIAYPTRTIHMHHEDQIDESPHDKGDNNK